MKATVTEIAPSVYRLSTCHPDHGSAHASESGRVDASGTRRIAIALVLALRAGLMIGVPAPSPAAAADPPSILVSDFADRADPRPLGGEILDHGVFIFATVDPAPEKGVGFVLDGSTKTLKTVKRSPFDLGGTDRKTGNGIAFDVAALAPGPHTLAIYLGGKRQSSDLPLATAEFTVVRPAPKVLVSTQPTRAGAEDLDGASLTGAVYVFTNAPGAKKVEYFLDVPITGKKTRSATKAPFDYLGLARGLPKPLAISTLTTGVHVMTTRVTYKNGDIDVVEATFGANASAGPSKYEQILAQMDDEGVLPRDAALQAFAAAVAPLPGVTVPDGPMGDALRGSGTAAMTWVLGYWDTLTAEQQAAVEAALGFGLSSGASLAAAAAASTTPLAAVVPPDPACPTVTADSPAAAAFRPDINTMVATYEDSAHLNRTLPFPFYVRVNSVHMHQDVDTLAYACPIPSPDRDADKPLSQCNIHIEPEGAVLTGNDKIAVYAHEVFHCFQYALGTYRDVVGHPNRGSWIVEGQAAWAGETIADEQFTGASNLIIGIWDDYVLHPETVLFKRVYDAIGFYAQIDHAGVEPWTTFDAQFMAGQIDSPTAYSVATAPVTPKFQDTWASSYFRNTTFTSAWDMDGPGLPAGVKYTPPVYPITNGNTVNVTTLPWTESAIRIDSSADVVELAAVGIARFHDNASFDVVRFPYLRVCTRPGGCVCPLKPWLDVMSVSKPLYVGLTGDTAGTGLAIQGVALDDWCNNPSPPPVPPTPPAGECFAAAGCGAAWGDPHLITWDGYLYDLQTAGELVLARSTADNLEIQVRHRPSFGSRYVSVNTAFAARVGGDRVTLTMVPYSQTVVARVNGDAFTAPDGTTVPLPGGGFLHFDDKAFSLIWPDGTRVFVREYMWGLNAVIKPAAERLARLEGLLGDGDGNSANDLAPQGSSTPLSHPLSFADLYDSFADSWRITDATSLFDYETGESTATFTDRTFPDAPRTVDDLDGPTRSAAEATCTAAGVSGPFFDNCVLDVGMTGETAFADGAADLQELYDEPPPGTITIDGPTVTLEVSAPGATDTVTFAATAGQKVFVDLTGSTLPDDCFPLQLRAPDSSVLALSCVLSGTGFVDGMVLPASGTYSIAFDPSGTNVGAVDVTLTSATDQTGTVSVGGAPVTATIGQKGATSAIAFAGTAGDTVFVHVAASNLPDACTFPFLRAPDDSAIGAGCVIGGTGFVDTVTLPQTGTYTVVVDPAARATGSLTFSVIPVADQVGPVTVDGPPVVANIDGIGKRARFIFTGTLGDKIRIDVSASTLPDACGFPFVLAPDTSAIAGGCVVGGTGAVDTFTLPATGTYTIVVDPAGLATGSLTLAVNSAP